jgi:hypothetical protein
MKLGLWALATLIASAVPTLAAAPSAPKLPSGVVLSEDQEHVTVRPVSTIRTKSTAAPPISLPAIFDNLAEKYPDGRYDPYGGSGVWGPNVAGFDSRNWTGASFTPAANATVAKVSVAVKLISGTNRVVLSLRRDNAGLPGAALETWVLTNLPAPVTCCTTKVVTADAGIALQAGQQYWIVLATDADSQDTFVTWSSNVTEPLQPTLIAHNQGGGWNGFTTAPAPAFAVFASP